MRRLQEMSLEELWQLFPIVLREHQPFYAAWYEEEKEKLLSVLPGACRINHIGSTAVAGLVAKPIVDILLELPATYSTAAMRSVLEKAGWLLMAENRMEKTFDYNKGYTLQGFGEKVYHLHVKPLGDWGELYFRDYLQLHTDAAQQYEKLKIQLGKQFEHDRDAYTEGKTKFVNEHTQKAKDEFGRRYAPKQQKEKSE